MKSKLTSLDNSFIKKNWSWLLAAVITLAVLFVVMITGKITPFGEYSLLNYDCLNQYMPFYSEYRHKLLNHENLFYTWNAGLGTDFYLVYVYYLACPLNYLLILFKAEDLAAVISAFICIKIVISAATFGYYLSRREGEIENKFSITGFSVAYALSGYMCGYYWNAMWLDSILVFPLIILGLNKLMTGKSPILYISALFFSLFCNFYITFMICIFLVLWFFTYDFENVKDVIMKGLKFAGCSILAAGMSAFTLVVMFRGLFTDTSYEATVPKFDFYGNIAVILRSHYYLSKPVLTDTFPGHANVYIGVITLILALIYPFISKISRRERITKVIIALFMLISMNVTTLNYIWHGFHEQMGIPNRFAFIYGFILLEMAYDSLDKIHHISHARLIPGCVISIILPLIVYIFTDYNGFVNSRAMLTNAFIMSFIYVAFICASALGDKYYNILSTVIVLLLLVEISSSAYISLRFNNLNHTMPTMKSINGFWAGVDYVEKSHEDNDFYREDVARHSIANESTFLNIKGTGTFNSTTDRSFIDTMAFLGYKVNNSFYYYYSDTPVSPVIDDIFGVKYIHSYSDEFDRADYKLIHEDDNGAKVFENTDALPVGFVTSKELIKSYLVVDYDAAYNQNTFLELASGMQGPYTFVFPDLKMSSECCDMAYDEENQRVYCSNIFNTIGNGLYEAKLSNTIEEDGEYYISLQNSYIANLIISKNKRVIFRGGESLELISLGNLKSGDQLEITMQIPIAGGDGISIPIYMARYDHEVEREIIKKLSENTFHVSSYTCNSLKGDVTINEGEMLFLSVPYSEGWEIKVDGKPSGYDRTVEGFIGIVMEPGDHKVEMEYIPIGLMPGVIITLISWLIFLVMIVMIILKEYKKGALVKANIETDIEDDTDIENVTDTNTEEEENGNNAEGQ